MLKKSNKNETKVGAKNMDNVNATQTAERTTTANGRQGSVGVMTK